MRPGPHHAVFALILVVTAAWLWQPKPGFSATSTAAREGDTVLLHYTARVVGGDVIETTEGGPPRGIEIGSRRLLPAFEDGLLGIRAGERRLISVPAAEGFGPYRTDPGIRTRLPRATLAHSLDLHVGMQLNAAVFESERSLEATHVPVTVVELTPEYVVVDANHPLAGKDLEFDVEAVEVIRAID